MRASVAVVFLVVATAVPLGCSRRGADVADDEGDFLEADGNAFQTDGDADVYTGPAPLTVRFRARTINAVGGASYRWTFDDRSTTSTEQDPVHTFTRQGWYRVTMDARDGAGRTDRANLLLHVWRPRDWAHMQRHRDMRIVMRSLRELQRKNAEPAPIVVADGGQSP